MKRASVVGTAAIALSAIVGWNETAHAAPCSDLNLQNPLVVTGSTAVGALIEAVAPKLATATGDNHISIISVSTGSTAGSCSGVSALAAGTTVTANGVSYWDNTGTKASCDLSNEAIDFVFSDVFIESCGGDTSSLAQQSLLVLPFEFIAPTASDQVAIDAREGYYAYGRGVTANITPWNVMATLFQRNQGSGTQITVFKNLHVPVTAALGTDAGGSGTMITKVGTSTDPQKTLGFVSSDYVLKDGGSTVKPLAYRHWGQTKFYWADSSTQLRDKQNVRDGHYPIWSYEHAVLKNGGVDNALGQKLADFLSGKTALPGTDVNAVIAKAGFVPTCAMEVARTTDASDFTQVTTGNSCACAFEKAAGPTGGTPDAACGTGTCTTNTDCSGGRVCRNSYCEAR